MWKKVLIELWVWKWNWKIVFVSEICNGIELKFLLLVSKVNGKYWFDFVKRLIILGLEKNMVVNILVKLIWRLWYL